jgi:hypothetical protein
MARPTLASARLNIIFDLEMVLSIKEMDNPFYLDLLIRNI